MFPTISIALGWALQSFRLRWLKTNDNAWPLSIGLAYGICPYVVIDKLTVWQAASATEALAVVGIGCLITVPAIVGYTIFSYRIFRGKARPLACA